MRFVETPAGLSGVKVTTTLQKPWAARVAPHVLEVIANCDAAPRPTVMKVGVSLGLSMRKFCVVEFGIDATMAAFAGVEVSTIAVAERVGETAVVPE